MNLADLATPHETAHESGGYLKGVAIGIVTDNHDPDGLCRVKVRFPWHEQPRESYWARLAMPMAGNDRGFVTIPEIDDEVLVAFEREDLRFPYILGSLWNGKDKPPAANDDGNNDRRMWKSRSGSYLLYHDGAQGLVELTKEDGKRVLFDQSKVLLEDGQGSKLTMQASGITIETSGTLTIKASGITIESSSTLEAKASATMTLRGALVNIN